MRSTIRFRIILDKPTPDVVFALQQGKGNNYEAIQRQSCKAGDLVFEFDVNVKGEKNKDKQPRFSGSVVQGPSAGQFVYIDIGTYAGQMDSAWSGRLKIPLSGLTWEDVEGMGDNSLFVSVVPGTGKDGGPNCATVKPFEGWRLQ